MFSKYELYATADSIYCYSGTSVLRNRLGIRDQTTLKAAEAEITAVKQYEMLLHPISGRFSKTHLCRIHRFLFEDLYAFAGHLRKEQIGKASTVFYPPSMIDRELSKICRYISDSGYFLDTNLTELLDRLSYVMAELNIIHPFREGNGRSIREFIRILALRNNCTLNWGLVDHEDVLSASICSINDYQALVPVLANCIEE